MEQTNLTKSMSVSDAVACRFSCRDYLPKGVSLDLIMQILDEARHAPSSGNLQPWKIYLVHGQNKNKLTNIIKSKIEHGISLDLPLGYPIYPDFPLPFFSSNKFKQNYPKYYQRHANMGKLLYTSQGIKRWDYKKRMETALRAFDFWGAPIGLIFTIDKGMVYGQYPDIGILLQSIMLLCEQYGLSTCCIVGMSLQHKTLKKALNIDENQKVFCGMSIGYKNEKAAVNTFKTERMALDEMVVIPEINENIKMESVYLFKAKVGLTMVPYYISEILTTKLSYLIVIISSVAITLWLLL